MKFRIIDFIAITVCVVVLGIIGYNQFNQPKEKTSESSEQVYKRSKQIYTNEFNEEETLKKKAQKYELYLIGYLSGYEYSREDLQDKGLFNTNDDIKKVYPEFPDTNSAWISYYYNPDDDFLTQLVSISDSRSRVTKYLYTVYNKDLQIINQYEYREEPYL